MPDASLAQSLTEQSFRGADMQLGGVLEFGGWRLSDACRHAEMRGCDVELAWMSRGVAYVRAHYCQRVADAIACDVIAGTIAISSIVGPQIPSTDGMDMSTRISLDT